MKHQMHYIIVILLLCATVAFGQKTKTIDGGILNESALSLPEPTFPAAARAVKACDTINVAVMVGEDGKIVSASAISGHPLLRGVSVRAAKQAEFAPVKLNKRLVKVSGVLFYVFPCEEKN